MTKNYRLAKIITLSLCFVVVTATAAQADLFDWFSSKEVDTSYTFKQANLLQRALLSVQDDYVDASLIKPKEMFIKSLQWIEKAVPSVLVQIDEENGTAVVTVGTASNSYKYGTIKTVYDTTPIIKKIFAFIEENVPNLTEKEKQEIEYATINGMLSTLDPHSVFLSPKGYEELSVSTSGSFGGLGIVISIRDRALTVISPISGTPAARAGIKAMDKITRIGDESTVNMELEDAVDRMRGEPGTKVKIWVQREGWTEPKMFIITRELISVKSVTHKLLENDVGYINLKHFQRDTSREVSRFYREMVEQSGKQKLKGIILDLRDDPGGLLDQAIRVSDFFIKEGTIVLTEGRSGNDKERAWNDDTEPDCPVIVLINGGSASASEIVAGALKNNNIALVMGEQSFGKGSVQIINDSFPLGTALKLTIAQYLTPGNISIQNVGITPDVVLTQLNIDKDSLRLSRNEPLFKESSWENSLSTDKNNAAKEAKPSHYFSYLEAKKVDKNNLNDEEVVIDYQIELAQKLLSTMKTSHANRKAMLKEIGPLLNNFAKEQDLQLKNAMKEILVDWKSCPESVGQNRDINAAVKFDIVNEKGEHYIKGGDKIKIKVLVTNKGKTPLCQLRAKTVADSGIFNNRELAFGLVEPNSTRAWEVPLEVPSDIYPWNELVDLQFSEQFNRLPTTPGVQVKIDSLPSPTFAMQHDLLEVFGDGDGKMQVGEKFEIAVKVKNTSNVDAEDVLINIKNMGSKEILIEHGRSSIGKLAAGQEVETTLKFEVKHFSKTGVQLKLFISDMKTGEFLISEIKRPIFRPQKGSVAKEIKNVKPNYPLAIDNPVIHTNKDLLGAYSQNGKVTLAGTITDKDKLLDAYIYVNNQKVFYKNFSSLTADNGIYSGEFKVDVELKEGPNIISIIARESDQVIRRQTFAIYRMRTKPKQSLDSSLLIDLP